MDRIMLETFLTIWYGVIGVIGITSFLFRFIIFIFI